MVRTDRYRFRQTISELDAYPLATVRMDATRNFSRGKAARKFTYKLKFTIYIICLFIYYIYLY
jgi:hypothetical protein